MCFPLLFSLEFQLSLPCLLNASMYNTNSLAAPLSPTLPAEQCAPGPQLLQRQPGPHSSGRGVPAQVPCALLHPAQQLGASLGDAGYIRMAMFSPDYSSDDSLTALGTCGIYVYPAYFPISARECTLFVTSRREREQFFQPASISMGHGCFVLSCSSTCRANIK